MNHAALASALNVAAIIGAGDPSAPVVRLPDGSPLPSPLDKCAAHLLTQPDGTDLLAAACKWECRRRILARYSETDQTNSQRRATVLLRRFAAGTATAAELAEGDALEAASDWIDAMTAHWRVLAAEGRSPFAPDANWPAAPQA